MHFLIEQKNYYWMGTCRMGMTFLDGYDEQKYYCSTALMGARWPLFLLLAASARAVLEVMDGPSALVGANAPAAPYSFSPARFSLVGPLVYTRTSDWELMGRSKPPRFTGATGALAGAIVLFENVSPRECSHEMYTRSAMHEGALATLFFVQYDLYFDVQPGAEEYRWVFGDTGALSVPGFDISSRDAEPIVRAVRAGAPVRARLSRQISAWRQMWDSPWWPLWQAFNGLHALSNVELAGLQLSIFIQVDEGLRVSSIAHVMLLVELLHGIIRVCYMVDPFFSRGVFELHISFALLYVPIVLSTLATAILLTYYLQAASLEGIATLRLKFARFLTINASLNLIVYLLLEALAVSRIGTLVKVVIISMLYPMMILAFAAGIDFSIRRTLIQVRLPQTLIRRISKRVQQTVALSTIQLVLAFVVTWAAFAPWRLYAVWGLFSIASNRLSTVCAAPIMLLHGGRCVGARARVVTMDCNVC